MRNLPFILSHILILFLSFYLALNFIHSLNAAVVLLPTILVGGVLLFGTTSYQSIVENPNFLVRFLLRPGRRSSGMKWFMDSLKKIEDPELRIKVFEEWQYRFAYTYIPLNLFFLCGVYALSDLRTSNAMVFSVKLMYLMTLLLFVSGISIFVANYYFSSWMLKVSGKEAKDVITGNV